jgi:alpha-beta hydrolase superfamily lysophospholipase
VSGEHARALYIPGGTSGDASVFAFFHPAGAGASTGVLVCPPFGWDDTCSYRSRRDWAMALADAGLPAMRIDLPGTGDSAGSAGDGGLVSSWTAAVTSAAQSLRALSGCERLAAVGIGLGGLVAVNALGDGAELEQIVLWGVPAAGRTLVRELRVFAGLEESGPAPDPATDSAPLLEGSVWAGGFLLGADTAAELQALDLAATDLSGTALRRALLLERDGISVDAGLRSHLLACGVAVDVARGDGYGAMMAKPHYARTPRQVIDNVTAWLDPSLTNGSVATASGVGTAPRHARGGDAGASEAMLVSGGALREHALHIEQPFGELFGIVSEPNGRAPADVCVILLNAGAIRRVGPNRMWVEAARRWAATGVRTLRLDLEGIGDADGDAERFSELAELYTPRMTAQVGAAIDALAERGLGRRFVLCGLCSGAYWAFHAAHGDERVIAALLLNPQALVWDPSLETARELRKGMRGSSMRRVLGGEVPLERLVGFALAAPLALPRRALKRRGDRAAILDTARTIAERGQQLSFIFSGNEPLLEELEHDGSTAVLTAMPNVTLETIPGRIHTLRPREAQRRAHEALDRALQAAISRPAAGARVA